MNKYYTPTIEEFHVGFEYERLNYNTETFEEVKHPCDFIDWNMKPIQFKMHIEKKEIRVKYLDQEDIESLGWETGIYSFGNKVINVYYKGIFIITSITKDYIVDISILPSFKQNGLSRVFRGTVKNKSEFKKLMQQLGINEYR